MPRRVGETLTPWMPAGARMRILAAIHRNYSWAELMKRVLFRQW
jgi:hypothetical protein